MLRAWLPGTGDGRMVFALVQYRRVLETFAGVRVQAKECIHERSRAACCPCTTGLLVCPSIGALRLQFET